MFGLFLHLGGRNRIPLTYVDNCADAVVRAGADERLVGEILNVVDDDLPSSADLLARYKKSGVKMRIVPVPRPLLFLLSRINQLVSRLSSGQFPVVFKPSDIECYWSGYRYPNTKAKKLLDWTPRVPMGEALDRTFMNIEA
jgi:nucleoside-diphosphate-sugar epimerase